MAGSGGLRWWLRDPVLLAMALVAVAVVPWFLVGPGGSASSWVLQTALDLTICATARRLARLCRDDRPARRFWRTLTVTGLLCAAGDGYQTVRVLADPGDPGVSMVQTVLVVTGMALMVGVMLGHPLGRAGRERLRLWLDAATVLTGVAVFLWFFSVGAQVGGPAGGAVWAAAATSAVMLLVVFGVLKLILSGTAPFTRAAGIAGGAGVAGTAVGAPLSVMLTGTSDPRVMFVGQLLPCILAAAGFRLQELQTRRNSGGAGRDRDRRYSRFPYVAVVAVEVLLLAALPAAGPDVRVWGVAVGVLLITGLVLSRQLIAMHDNDRLLQRMNSQKDWFEALVRHSSDVTLVVGTDRAVRYASPAADRVLGVPAGRLLGTAVGDRVHPSDAAVLAGLDDRLAAGPGLDASAQLRLRHADGSYRWVDLVGRDLRGNPNVRGVVYNARDITEARALQEELHRRATHDGLTGLANRALLAERLAAAGRAEVSVLVLDLDGFKQVNDVHGHHAGDELLVEVAGRLRRALDPADLAVRLGGDEFAVLLPEASPARAEALARAVAADLSGRMAPAGIPLTIGASIGVATGPADDPALLRDADAAMYRVKSGRRAVAGR